MCYGHFYTINRSNIIIETIIIKPGWDLLQELILLLSYSCRNLSLAALVSVLWCKWQLQRHQCCDNAYRRVRTVATIWVLIPVKGYLLKTVEKRQGRAHVPNLRAKLHHLSENEKHIFLVIKLQKYLNLEFF